MGSRAVTQLITAEEFALLPDAGGTRDELVLGLVVSEPGPPQGRHGWIAARFVALLAQAAGAGRTGIVFGGSGFLLARNPDTVRAPDAAFVSRARFESEGRPEGYFSGAPDLAVEVLSPTNRPEEMRLKVAEYLSAGGRLVWVADPAGRAVTVWRSPLQPRGFGPDDVLSGEDVVPGFSVRVAELFEPF